MMDQLIGVERQDMLRQLWRYGEYAEAWAVTPMCERPRTKMVRSVQGCYLPVWLGPMDRPLRQIPTYAHRRVTIYQTPQTSPDGESSAMGPESRIRHIWRVLMGPLCEECGHSQWWHGGLTGICIRCGCPKGRTPWSHTVAH